MRIIGTFVSLSLVSSVSLGAQSTMIGRVASPQAKSEDILVIRELTAGVPIGKLAARHVIELSQKLDQLAEIAFASPATFAPVLHVVDASKAEIKLATSEVTTELLGLLDLRLSVGRPFVKDDEQAKMSPAILTNAVWQESFGSDPKVIGTEGWVSRNGERTPVVIIGVLKPDAGSRPHKLILRHRSYSVTRYDYQAQ